MGFNSGFKGLTAAEQVLSRTLLCRLLLQQIFVLLQHVIPMAILILHLLSFLRPCHESGD